MEEDSIEAQYEAEKERLAQEFLAGLAAGKNKEELESAFHKKMKELYAKFERSMVQHIEGRKRAAGRRPNPLVHKVKSFLKK